MLGFYGQAHSCCEAALMELSQGGSRHRANGITATWEEDYGESFGLKQRTGAPIQVAGGGFDTGTGAAMLSWRDNRPA